MEEIKALFQLDFVSIIISIVIIMSAVVSIATLIGKFSVIIGKPVRWIKKKNKDHELLIHTVKNVEILQEKQDEAVKQSIRHDEMIKDDINKLTETVNGIATTLTEMQQKSNDTELKKLKDTLVGYYNKFKNVGEWSKLDANVFWDLFDDYEKRGGDGYVHSIIEPVMRELKEN
jgi:hypothetical protein